jgi:hypothetical protein
VGYKIAESNFSNSKLNCVERLKGEKITYNLSAYQ